MQHHTAPYVVPHRVNRFICRSHTSLASGSDENSSPPTKHPSKSDEPTKRHTNAARQDMTMMHANRELLG